MMQAGSCSDGRPIGRLVGTVTDCDMDGGLPRLRAVHDTAPPCVTGWAVVFDANTGAPDR